MTPMVLGFMFNGARDSVVLIRKERPEWQRGKFNGVGGKVEEGESYEDAMIREFHEETGVLTTLDDWRYFCSFKGHGTHGPFVIKCFEGSNEQIANDAHTTTDEQVLLLPVNIVLQDQFAALDKLRWMVSLALDRNCFATVLYEVRR